MSRVMPKNMVIEFDDGSQTSVPFESLPMNLRIEILRQPFAGKPSTDPEKDRFVLLEWDDGWKEVIEVDAGCTDINRYYVITRPEDVGRLSLNKREDNPELIEIIRKPTQLQKITFMDTYQLTLDKSIREGKKTDHSYALAKAGDTLSEIRETFKKALEEEGMHIEELQSMDATQARDAYERIRRRMDLKAGQRQQDVYDFLAYLTGSLQ
ncbi:MAG: hypothetical protein JRJ85_18725 [Deltaproteobacteria bacterium]|nr:hypothetical protein [Deltaproteobacteria bacterium]